MARSVSFTSEAELLSRRQFTSQTKTRTACFSHVEAWCNPARPHSSLGDHSPIAYEAGIEAALTTAQP